MEVTTSRTTRRSTRIRAEVPLTVTSLDRVHPFQEKCITLIVNPQGCGFRSSRAIAIGTPVLLSDLPGGTATARVANCLPLGSEGKYFLIGASLYHPGNVWGIADPPEDWNKTGENTSAFAAAAAGGNVALSASGKSWPYNLFSNSGVAHPGRK
jgi:hypothetical protein